MSEIKVDEVSADISLNRQSLGLHNLTGTKSKVQPMRIKALLDLFKNDDDDDDTEPRDSDDNSDAESLQALPDDDEDDCGKNEPVSPRIDGTNLENGMSRASLKEEAGAVNSQFTEPRRNENSNDVDFRPEPVAPTGLRKTANFPPFSFDSDKPAIFTPRASQIAERREEGLTSFKRFDKPSEPETPLKFSQNSSKSALKVFETPMKRSHSDPAPRAAETPGLIFSHWSRNNYFQTPTTYNKILTSNKREEGGAHPIESQRFFNSENRMGRRQPLGEAIHLNQASGGGENPALERHNMVRRTLQLPNAVEGDVLIKENLANTVQRSLRDGTGGDKPSCTETKKQNFAEKKNCEGIVPSKNNNFEIESRNGRPAMSGPERAKTVSDNMNCRSGNPANVQYSVAAKPRDKQYGQVISVKGSDYVVLGKLGQGMSGNVLRVQEVKTGELRAIKCVDLSQIDKETAQGCLEEVSLLERLRAPCIINMIAYEIKSHWLYVVLEMGDTDLSKLLKSMPRDKQLPLTMILYYWTEMLTAVKHIHDNDVIHSDLKPANFLLVRGRLKLIDFGIASTMNSEMTSVVKNTSLGTLHYISPEAIEDVGGNGDSPSGNNKYKLNFQSDVWSLGCILYSLVYGQTPFEHIRADWAKVAAITNPKQKISFPPAQTIGRRGYNSPPPFLVDVMRRCLQHDKKARPTVKQLLDIPYVGCNCPPASSLPRISPPILSKIKEALKESEWRQLLDALERQRPPQ